LQDPVPQASEATPPANPEKAQALISAAQDGDSNSVVELLESGVDVNVEFRGRTPLRAAAAIGHEAVVERLLEGGARIDLADEFGRTALHEAASAGCWNAARVLLEAGGRADRPDDVGLTPLHLAAQEERPLVLDLLATTPWSRTHEIHMNARTAWGTTPLHEAAASGSTRCVRLLCRYRKSLASELEARDGLGRTPLHLAALRGDVATYQALVNAGADELAFDVFETMPTQYFQEAVECILGGRSDGLPLGDPSEAWDGEGPFLYQWHDMPYGIGPQGLFFAIWTDGVVLFPSDPERPNDSLLVGRISPSRARQLLDELRGMGLFDLSFRRNSYEASHVPYMEVRVRDCEEELRRRWAIAYGLGTHRWQGSSQTRSAAALWSRVEVAIDRARPVGSRDLRGFLDEEGSFRGFRPGERRRPTWKR